MDDVDVCDIWRYGYNCEITQTDVKIYEIRKKVKDAKTPM
jgi:hypothetical protein